MDSEMRAFSEPGIQAMLCTNCQSASKLELQDDQVNCRECHAIYKFIDGVLDFMPPNYDGYQGDSKEAAALRDAHNHQSLRDDTIHLRRMLDQLLRPKSLILDAGCGTGHLTKIISESHPDVTIIATDVSLPMCQLAAKNCSGQRIMIIRTPTSKISPMPFQNSVFDVVLNRLAPMDPREAFRLLRTGGYTVEARLVDSYWQEIKTVFPKDRIISHSRDIERKEALFRAGFSKAESHSWRSIKIRSLKEIITILKYTPTLRDFDEGFDQPFLSKLEKLYGDKDGIRMTEGESLTIGWKNT